MAKANKGMGLGTATAIVATIAAAAGTYFIYGTKEGAKQKKKVKGWALKAKGEVLEKIEDEDVSETSYNEAVSSVMKKYDKLKAEHGPEVEAVQKELHGYWNHLKKHLAEHAKKAITPKKPAAKKATKKTA